MSPPNLTFVRDIRRAGDVSLSFVPTSDPTGREVNVWRAHIILLTDLFLVCERVAPGESDIREGADLWLLFPPLAGRHLRVTRYGTDERALEILVMKKERLILRTSTLHERDAWMDAFDDTIAFGNTRKSSHLAHLPEKDHSTAHVCKQNPSKFAPMLLRSKKNPSAVVAIFSLPPLTNLPSHLSLLTGKCLPPHRALRDLVLPTRGPGTKRSLRHLGLPQCTVRQPVSKILDHRNRSATVSTVLPLNIILYLLPSTDPVIPFYVSLPDLHHPRVPLHHTTVRVPRLCRGTMVLRPVLDQVRICQGLPMATVHRPIRTPTETPIPVSTYLPITIVGPLTVTLPFVNLLLLDR